MLSLVSNVYPEKNVAILCQEPPQGIVLSEVEKHYLQQQFALGNSLVLLNQYTRYLFFIRKEEGHSRPVYLEKLRQAGASLCQWLNELKINAIQLLTSAAEHADLLEVAEGLLLANYQFLKYIANKDKANSLQEVEIVSSQLNSLLVTQRKQLIEAVCLTRHLVNEPLSYLTAEQLAQEASVLGKQKGFTTEVFNKSKIQSLRMGGLLAVNAGSPNPPVFIILEYKPEKAVNEKPYVLVGKGVVFDTGGLSLKPTEHSMDYMKMDMAGAAAVIGTFCALAANEIPLYTIGLIPATENRPDGNAMVPGDVITLYSGKTVEVLNTDAEGRLILADALTYAAKYHPELVIDLATLTGSAARATGKEGMVMMGTASAEEKQALLEAGFLTHERMVEFPLWPEYLDYLTSTVADLKNIGGAEAGAITAGKFLEQFASYPWMHLDIAGVAFLHKGETYKPTGGTGIGVRLLYHFLQNKTLRK